MAHVYVVHRSMDILSNIYGAYLPLSNLLVIVEYNIKIEIVWNSLGLRGVMLVRITQHTNLKNNEQFPWNMSAIIKYLVSQLIYRSVYVDLFEIAE